MKIRQIVTVVEETRRELDRPVEPATRQAAAIAVIANPYAGVYDEELEELQQAGAELGALLVRRAIDALGIDGASVASYGKAAIVGVEGEREHAAAVMHPRMGKPVREIVGPSEIDHAVHQADRRPGTVIDCPLHHKDEMWTFSHFDAMQFRSPTPRAATRSWSSWRSAIRAARSTGSARTWASRTL